MELYSSSAAKAALPAETGVYYSVSRLILFIIFWGLTTLLFAAFCVFSIHDKSSGMLLLFVPIIAFTGFNLWHFVKLMGRLKRPLLTVSRTGISGEGVTTPLSWADITECTHFVHTINAVTITRRFIIHTSLPIPETLSKRQQRMMRAGGNDHLVISVDARGIGTGNDAFTALCDSYKAAATEATAA